MGRPRINIVGQKFNKLTVISEDLKKSTNVMVQCDCGRVKSLDRYSVKNWEYNSCNQGPCNPTYRWVIGEVFGKLLVVEQTGIFPNRGREKVKAQCICGTIISVAKKDLIRGHRKSCSKGICKTSIVDITNHKFGMLLVVSFSHVDKNKQAIWNCLCDCGNTKKARSIDLRLKVRKNCGCQRGLILSKTHSLPLGDAIKNKIFDTYKRGSITRGYIFELSFEEFVYFISSNCFYCGIEPCNKYEVKNIIYEEKYLLFNGIDRKNNKLGYIKDNCVSCCAFCNRSKGAYEFDDFIAWINRLKNRPVNECRETNITHYRNDESKEIICLII